MFFVFLLAAKSKLIEYDPKTWSKHVKDSEARPIFTLFIDSKNQATTTASIMFYSLDKMLFANNHLDIAYSVIDCGSSGKDVCKEMNIESLPVCVMIRGTDPKKYPQISDMNPLNWIKFIEEESMNPIAQIENNNFGNRIMNTLNGASYFHLVIQKDHKEILDKFQSEAERYIQYGCKFTYKFKLTTRPSLRVYRSPFCMYKIKGNIGNFSWFLESNKFSFLHKYSTGDILQANKSKPLALYFLDDAIAQPQFDNWINVSTKYCNKIDFGLGDFGKTTSNMYAPMSVEDSPFINIRNSNKNCTINYKKSIIQGMRLGLYDHFIAGKSCSSFKEGWIKKRDPNRMMFALLAFILTAALIGLFVEVRQLLLTMKAE